MRLRGGFGVSLPASAARRFRAVGRTWLDALPASPLEPLSVLRARLRLRVQLGLGSPSLFALARGRRGFALSEVSAAVAPGPANLSTSWVTLAAQSSSTALPVVRGPVVRFAMMRAL